MKRPLMWNKKTKFHIVLITFSYVYSYLSQLNYKLKKKYRSTIPIISIGSPLIGGGGKTPTEIAIINFLITQGKSVCSLSKGYSGSIKEPTLVTKKHRSSDVGDEALLLSNISDTFVSHNRTKGLKYINDNFKYDFIVMDDGYRDISIENKINILVIDSNISGINHYQFPAGDYIGKLETSINSADFILVVDPDKLSNKIKNSISSSRKIIMQASTHFKNKFSEISDRVAFTGIGLPNKFYRSLIERNYNLLDKLTFKNHHRFTKKEIEQLINIGKSHEKYTLITTEKDFVRIDDENDPDHKLRTMIDVQNIEIKFNNLDSILDIFK